MKEEWVRNYVRDGLKWPEEPKAVIDDLLVFNSPFNDHQQLTFFNNKPTDLGFIIGKICSIYGMTRNDVLSKIVHHNKSEINPDIVKAFEVVSGLEKQLNEWGIGIKNEDESNNLNIIARINSIRSYW